MPENWDQSGKYAGIGVIGPLYETSPRQLRSQKALRRPVRGPNSFIFELALNVFRH